MLLLLAAVVVRSLGTQPTRKQCDDQARDDDDLVQAAANTFAAALATKECPAHPLEIDLRNVGASDERPLHGANIPEWCLHH
jgi:hypothetical protein